MAIGVGIDLVAVESVSESLAGPHAARYLERVYTDREVDQCRDSSGEIVADRLAARFAAKEAAIKALPGSGEEIRQTGIEVLKGPTGEVRIELSGRAAALAEEAGVTELAVSLTHEDGFAAAAVVTS